MAYEKFYPEGWKDNEDGATPITAASLNHMEKGIGDNDTAISDHADDKDNPHDVTAAQIGAAPASHTHTAADVGAQKQALRGTITIPTSGWGSDSTATYPKYYDIAVTGVTANDRASVDIAPASIGAAIACAMCPATETLAGKIRIRAASIPGTAMNANYWIEKGA